VKFFEKKSRPLWTFPKKGSEGGKKIWRLLAGNEILVTEMRDIDKKTAEFVGIDIRSGLLLWKNDQIEEKWWVTLNLIYRDVVLLQQFSRPDMPTSGRIFALDLRTGELLWKNYEVSFANAAGDTIYCVKKSYSSETTIGLDFRSGIVREVSQEETVDGNFVSSEDLKFPEPFEDALENLDEQILQKKIPGDAALPMILRSGRKKVIGFHVPSGKDTEGVTTYDAHLIVADSAGKIVFEDITDRKVYMPLAEFYFSIGEKLIYVRNSEEIVAVQLD